jgi:uroporphyrinogen-III synthase
MNKLAGLCVLVTRPERQAQGLCDLLLEAGALVELLPLLSIAPVADAAAVRSWLEAAHAWDYWIFTSANAVRYAALLDKGPWPRPAAAGAATAAALAEAGHPAVTAPDRQDGAAGLLADPRFANCAGRRILIVTGENTLPELAEGLAQRGAQVQSVAVYRRVPVQHEPSRVAAAITASDAAIISSAEALGHLLHLTPSAVRPLLFNLQLALPSARVVEKARQAGFSLAPLVPARVTDAAYVELLERWRRK